MSEKSKATPFQSIVAGAAAGGFESAVTYPTEYIKTRQQLLRGHSCNAKSPIQILLSTIREHGVTRLYTGCAAFCISNASKSGVRFLTFDSVRNTLPKDTSGKTTVLGNITAGLCAGVAESILVLTPGENIKTRLIDDAAGARVYKSSTHLVRSMLTVDGPMSFFRGVWPVTLKQSSNAMVRFTSYSLLSSALGSYTGVSTSVVAGSLAGVVTVYCTMPFDNIKTQMQSITGRTMYTDSWDCARQLVQRGGFQVLWKGTTPRLVRLSVSGALSFTVYEQTVQLLRSATIRELQCETHAEIAS